MIGPTAHSRIRDDCQGVLHPMAIHGISLFNRGEYWKAHEALELAWLDEKGNIRNLYRGILKVGVMYLHIERGNYRGALKLYRRSQRWLAPFTGICRGVNIEKLRADVEIAIHEVRRLGPDKMELFDRSLLWPVEMGESREEISSDRKFADNW